jgi:hypothetical protein
MTEKEKHMLTKRISERETIEKNCDFFLSYSNDDKYFANQLIKKIEEHGLNTWVADINLKTNTNIYKQIRDAIIHSRSCIILLSRSSSVSKPLISQEWTTIQECAWLKPELKIYVILIEDVEPPSFLQKWSLIKTCDNNKSVDGIVDKIIRFREIDKKIRRELSKVEDKKISERFINIYDYCQEFRENANIGDIDESE